MARESGLRQTAPQKAAGTAPGHSYDPMARLFDDGDLQYLQSQKGYRPGMATRLRLERRAVLSLYLRQARADFRRSWELCRSSAPHNQEFASQSMKQLAAFYGLYARLQLQCLLVRLVYVRADTGSLPALLDGLQQRARRAVSTELPAAGLR